MTGISSQWLRAQQERLERIGLYTAGVDGDWGPGTERAIELAIEAAEKARGVVPPRYPGLPAAYRWLLTATPLPLIVHEGLKLLGTKEIAGARHSAEILGWARELGIGTSVPSDEQAWCGLFIAIVAKRAGKDISKVGNILGARQWLKFGVRAERPGLGDVLVFWRGSIDGWQGHVGQYIGEDDGHYHVLGGNQSNMVNIMRMAKGRLLEARRPIYNNQPTSVKPYRVSAAGAVSTNEA